MPKRVVVCTGTVDCLILYCPGCRELHQVGVRGDGPIWMWDGNEELPTLSPSIRVYDAQGTRCHSFVRSGQIEFLGDCRHELAGKTVDLPDYEEWREIW